jgi:hypothetical protein
MEYLRMSAPFRDRAAFLLKLTVAAVLVHGIFSSGRLDFHELSAIRDRWPWVFAYFVGFSALFHITEAGRINLPMKLLLSFFAAYLLSEIVSKVLEDA